MTLCQYSARYLQSRGKPKLKLAFMLTAKGGNDS